MDQQSFLKEDSIKKHTDGHRDRLRARFIKGGKEALADYELLELLLFMAIPRKDVKPLAKDLIARFGGFAEVISADLDRLCTVKGLSENSAIALKIVQAAAQTYLQGQIMDKPVLGSWQALLDYCQAAMGHEKKEFFRILFLDRKNRLIADEVQQEGTIDHTPVYPREVIKRALELHATALILVHNHPSGDPTPSKADIDMTRAIIEAGKAIEIVVHDHLIIAKGKHASFRTLGLL